MERYLIAASILVLLLMGSCRSEEDAGTTMYVLATSATASRLQGDLASLAQRHGLIPSVGHATDDGNHTLSVVEAKGRRMRLRGQNMPLSGHEDASVCGRHAEAYPDPGQYIVTIKSAISFLGTASVHEVAAQLRRELSDLGYDVREEPLLCSALAKSVL
jgi:hypothetical protein